jgi:hypothetical protein
MKRRPVFTLLSLLSAAFFYFASIPILNVIVDRQLATAEYNSDDAREDAGRMSGLAVIAGAFVAGVAGAAVGLILAMIAHIRREPLSFLRALTFSANLAVVAYGVYRIYPLRRS